MANVTRFDPFNDLVDDLFKGFLVRPVSYEGRGEALPRVKVDVAEINGAYTVNADLPGVRKEDIQVSIDGAEVTLKAEARFRDGVLELKLPKKAAAARKQVTIQ